MVGKGKEKAAAPTFIRRSCRVKYSSGAHRSPPVVQRKTETQFKDMSPGSLESFAKECHQAGGRAELMAASKRQARLPAYGFQPTQEEVRRQKRATDRNVGS